MISKALRELKKDPKISQSNFIWKEIETNYIGNQVGFEEIKINKMSKAKLNEREGKAGRIRIDKEKNWAKLT